MVTTYQRTIGATSAAVGARYPIVGTVMGVASNPTDPSNIVSSLTTAATARGSAVGVPAVGPILAQTAMQVLGIKQPDGSVMLEDGTRISATQAASMGLPASTPAGTAVAATPTVPLGTTPTAQRTSYQNVVQPSTTSGMFMPTTTPSYGRTSTSFASTNQPITYAPGRSPIMDGTQTVGFTEVASDGTQKVYYVVAGYPKSGMPKPGTYRKGVAIPRARKMRYNKRKPRTTKSKKKIATSQKKMTKSWLGKKLLF